MCIAVLTVWVIEWSFSSFIILSVSLFFRPCIAPNPTDDRVALSYIRLTVSCVTPRTMAPTSRRRPAPSLPPFGSSLDPFVSIANWGCLCIKYHTKLKIRPELSSLYFLLTLVFSFPIAPLLSSHLYYTPHPPVGRTITSLTPQLYLHTLQTTLRKNSSRFDTRARRALEEDLSDMTRDSTTVLQQMEIIRRLQRSYPFLRPEGGWRSYPEREGDSGKSNIRDGSIEACELGGGGGEILPSPS